VPIILLPTFVYIVLPMWCSQRKVRVPKKKKSVDGFANNLLACCVY